MACDLKHATSSVKHGGDNVAQIVQTEKKKKINKKIQLPGNIYSFFWEEQILI